MEEAYTIDFECLACGSIVCLHNNLDVTKQLSYLLTSKCPGCGTFGYVWRLKAVEPDNDDGDPGKEVIDKVNRILN